MQKLKSQSINQREVVDHLIIAKTQLLLAETSIGFEAIMWCYQAIDNLFSALLKTQIKSIKNHYKKFQEALLIFPKLKRIIPLATIRRLLGLWINGRYKPIKTERSSLILRRHVYNLEAFVYGILNITLKKKKLIYRSAIKHLGETGLDQVYNHIQNKLDKLDSLAKEMGYSGFGATQASPLVSTRVNLYSSRMLKSKLSKFSDEIQLAIMSILDKFTVEIVEKLIFDNENSKKKNNFEKIMKAYDFDIKLILTYQNTNLKSEAFRMGKIIADRISKAKN